MEVTKVALLSNVALAVLALAAANVRSLYQTTGGHEARSVDSNPIFGNLENFHRPGHYNGSTDTYSDVPDGGRFDPAGQGEGEVLLSDPQDPERFKSSQFFGEDEQQDFSRLRETQSTEEQQRDTRDKFSGREQFQTIFLEDVTRPSSPGTVQVTHPGFSSQLSDPDSPGSLSFGHPQGLGRPPLLPVQQQNGGLMFSSHGQDSDSSVEEEFPGVGFRADAAAGANGLSFAGGLSSAPLGGVARLVTASEQFGAPAQVTITREVTVDRFTTLTNLAYHSVPVTLTEFLKVTVTAPTFETITTPVENMVVVSRVPVSRTDTITVTDTNSGYQYATEVSTVLYTITHKLYDIRQQTITSLVVQTQLVRPRVVSTHIDTEYETQTVVQTVTNTIFLDPRVPRSGPVLADFARPFAFQLPVLNVKKLHDSKAALRFAL